MPTFSDNVCYVWLNVRSPWAFIAANTKFNALYSSVEVLIKLTNQNYNATAPLKVISKNNKSDSELVK